MDNKLAVEKLSLYGQCTVEHVWANLKSWLRNYSKNYANIKLAILDYFQLK